MQTDEACLAGASAGLPIPGRSQRAAERRRDAPVKGLVLAGGKGTRLRPFTYTGAKQLVPIANKPILFYAVEDLVASGITEIGIVLGDTGEQVARAVGDGSRFGARVTYIEQPAPLGIAHAVKISRDFLRDSPFVLFLGDNLLRGGITPYVERFIGGSDAALVVLKEVPNPQDYGVAEFEGERLVRVVEKPHHPPSNLAVIGIYMFDARFFGAADRLTPSGRGELEITEAIQLLIEDGLDIAVEVTPYEWIDTGKHDDLLSANRLALEDLQRDLRGTYDHPSKIEGKVVLEAGARVENSVIQGPTIIGERTRIINSYIGPYTAVYHDCLIQHSEITSSLVMEESVIDSIGQRIEFSLIGRRVELRGMQRRPRGYRVVLGDFSKVGVP